MSKKILRLSRISDYPIHYANIAPESEAAVLGSQRLSYSEFSRLIDQCARALLAAGVSHGDRIATLSNPHPHQLVIFMATSRIGAIWLGLNTRSRYDELAYVVADAKPKLIFSIREFEGRDFLEDIKLLNQEHDCVTGLILLDEVPVNELQTFHQFLDTGNECDGAVFDNAVKVVASRDSALIVYTSGSTGKPKGALLSHQNIIVSASTQCEYWYAKPLRILNNMPINHLGGSVQLASYAIVAGGTNVLMERFVAKDILALIASEKITVIHQTSTMYQMIFDSDTPEQHDLSSLSVVIWSGSACPIELIRRLREMCPNLFTSYGQTETGGEVLYVPAGASNEKLAGSVGVPPTHIKLRLVDDDGIDVTIDEVGEIQVKSDMVMLGYWQRPGATREVFTEDGWLRTGDLAEKNAEGCYRIVGRLKEMYKSGGYNIYPREIETVLESHPSVSVVAVIGVSDPLYSEVGHAFIILNDKSMATEAELNAFCREKLANYKIPKKFILCESLPLLPIGKIDKVALKHQATR